MQPRFKKGDKVIDKRNGHRVDIRSDPIWDEQWEEWSYQGVYRSGPKADAKDGGLHVYGTYCVGFVDDWLEPLKESLSPSLKTALLKR